MEAWRREPWSGAAAHFRRLTVAGSRRPAMGDSRPEEGGPPWAARGQRAQAL